MDYRAQFLNVLKARGVPVSEQEQKALWEQSLVGQGLAVKNQSPQSPFWRAQKAIVGEATSQLINVLVDEVMPNTFILLAKDKWLDQHGEGRNTPRLQAVKAVGNLTITRTQSDGALLIPAFTRVQSTPVNGRTYELELLNDIHFVDGEVEKIAVARAMQTGSEYNLVAGYYSQFNVPIEGVSVINLDDWLLTPGQDVESDENYRLRCRDKFSSLGGFHVDAVYRAIISEFPGILADNIAFDHSAPRGPGSANAYVYLNTGTVSQALLNDINNHIGSGLHGNGDDLQVLALARQGVSVIGKYWLHANADDIHEELKQCIRSAFRDNAAYDVTRVKPKEQFSFSLLASELHAHFPALKSIEFETADIHTGLWLPSLDTLTMERQ